MSKIEESIKENLNENKRLDCSDAFKIAIKLKISPKEVGDMAKTMDIKIDSCALGQFGKLDSTQNSETVLEKLKPFIDKEGKIECKTARELAQGIGLPLIRGTIKKNNIDVTYCMLGCFTHKKRPRYYVKTKICIENGLNSLQTEENNKRLHTNFDELFQSFENEVQAFAQKRFKEIFFTEKNN